MKKEKKSSIELLRILSMIMILFLHIFNYTGLLYAVEKFTINYYLIWMLEALCFVAVNCYVLISGYFLVESKFSFNRILKIWIQTFFYSILITFVISYFKEISFTEVIKSFFPIITTRYWFVTVYITLLLISPFLNVLIKNISKKKYQLLLITNLIMFSVIPIVPIPSGLLFGGGYGIAWFINLYLIAGYIKLYGIKLKKYKCLCIYFLMSIITFFVKYILDFIEFYYFRTNLLYDYNCITVLIASIGLFLFFINSNITNNFINKIIFFVSPLTFGVYLIHENPIFRNTLWEKINIIAYINSPILIIKVIAIVIILFIIFILIDFVRLLLFKKINPSINKIGNNLDSLYKKYL